MRFWKWNRQKILIMKRKNTRHFAIHLRLNMICVVIKWWWHVCFLFYKYFSFPLRLSLSLYPMMNWFKIDKRVASTTCLWIRSIENMEMIVNFLCDFWWKSIKIFFNDGVVLYNYNPCTNCDFFKNQNNKRQLLQCIYIYMYETVFYITMSNETPCLLSKHLLS